MRNIQNYAQISVNTSNGVYQVEHPIALQVAGLEKPKRKRGRPPKKHKTPEELAQEAAAKERELKALKKCDRDDEPTGKRRRKTPTRFREAVQVLYRTFYLCTGVIQTRVLKLYTSLMFINLENNVMFHF